MPTGRKRKRPAGDAASRESGRLFVSLCIIIAVETLFFWPGFVNAYAAPKLVAALLGAALLLPQLLIFLSRRSSPTAWRRLSVLLSLTLIAVTWSTVNSMSPDRKSV